MVSIYLIFIYSSLSVSFVMKCFIIGKNSNLSRQLSNFIKNTTLVSLSKAGDIDKILKYKKKFNLIFNNFYPMRLINSLDIKNLDSFYEKSLLQNIQLIKRINYKYVNKIIYTSSSSIYNSLDVHENDNDKFNRKIYSSVKLSNEKLILNISERKKICCHILRIFNIYGGRHDKFSIIFKINDCIKKNKKFTLFNKGTSIRDFIHVEDICKIYEKILISKKKINKILDLGTGTGFRIADIVNCSGIKKKDIIISNKYVDEISASVADMRWLKKFFPDFKFESLIKNIKFQKRSKIKIYKYKDLKKPINQIFKN